MEFKTEKLLMLLSIIIGGGTILITIISLMFANQFLPGNIDILSIRNIPIHQVKNNQIFFVGFIVSIVIKIVLFFVIIYAYLNLNLENHRNIAITLMITGVISYNMFSEIVGVLAIISGALIFVTVNKYKD